MLLIQIWVTFVTHKVFKLLLFLLPGLTFLATEWEISATNKHFHGFVRVASASLPTNYIEAFPNPHFRSPPSP